MSTISLRAVRTPAAAITSLANDFEPSMRAASFVGPKQAIPALAHRVGHPEHQRHLGPDDHQVGADPLGQLDDGVAGGDVDVVLVGDDRGAGIARRDGQLLDLGVLAQREQQRMFTGTGSDHQDAHN